MMFPFETLLHVLPADNILAYLSQMFFVKPLLSVSSDRRLHSLGLKAFNQGLHRLLSVLLIVP